MYGFYTLMYHLCWFFFILNVYHFVIVMYYMLMFLSVQSQICAFLFTHPLVFGKNICQYICQVLSINYIGLFNL